MKTNVQRGQVYWTNLDPVQGSEISKTRPCVILSANEINSRRRTVVIVPLTNTPEAMHFPLVIDVPSAGIRSKARSEHIRSIDKSRLKSPIGRISDADLDSLSRGVAKVLGLNKAA